MSSIAAAHAQALAEPVALHLADQPGPAQPPRGRHAAGPPTKGNLITAILRPTARGAHAAEADR